MNLLSLLLLALVALGIATTVTEKVPDNNNVPQQVAADDKSQEETADDKSQEETEDDNGGDKKVAKRSYGWNPWIYSGYSYGWPWYGFGGGHGWYPGWYSGWPAYYGHGYGGGYYGYRGYGGWYKGW